MARCPVEKSTPEGVSWIDGELARSKFRDERLGQRLRKIVAQLDGAMGEPIPLACADWANTKAAYRFLSNEDVSEGEILAATSHLLATESEPQAALFLLCKTRQNSSTSGRDRKK